MEVGVAPLVVALSATGELTVAPFAGDWIDTLPFVFRQRACADVSNGNKRAAASTVY